MTHEELLAKLNSQIESSKAMGCECMACDNAIALRAVVELHRPSPEGRYEKPICVGCSFTETGHYVLYPCRNIQAIQKELA